VPPPTLATRYEAPKTLEDLADDFLRGPSPRTERGLSPILKPGPVTAVDDLKRLETFMERRAWANAVTTANQLLHGANSHYAPLYESLLYDSSPLALQTHQNDLFYILSTLCKALTAMGSMDELQRELQSWKFLHFQNKGDAVHQSIPWSLHITAAAASRNLDALWAIRTALLSTQVQDGQVQDGDQQKALMMVENSIANAAGSDWRLVLAALERMLRLSKDRSVEILSRQGRALLQAGAVKEARIIFDRAAQEQQRTPERPLDQAQIFVNSGLLQFSEGSYEESWGSLKSATQILRTIMYERGEGDKAASECTDLYGEAVNNMAVAALYLCRLDDALQLMEALVREDVTLFLTDRVATNLCTLYELASDSNVSSRKKKVLQLIAKRFSLHDIKAECFRINQ
jgi:tetratricopeptide (TPR) repeat protein